MKGRNSGAVFLFIGAVLTFCFGVGVAWMRNPGMLYRSGDYSLLRNQFLNFCGSWWLPLGIIGIPMLLISLIVCLVRERKDRDR